MKLHTPAALLLAAFIAVCIGRTIISNGDFSSGDTQWTFGDYRNVADGRVVDGEYRIDISTAQQEEWAVQLMQSGITLSDGKNYELTFDAYADTDKTIVVSIGPGVSGDISVPITPSKMTCSVAFSTQNGNAHSCRLDFNMGKISGMVALDNVVIKEFVPEPDTTGLPEKDCSFPTASRYPFGIKPSNFTQSQMNRHCMDWFRMWKEKYLTQQGCRSGEYRVQRIETGDSNTHDTVSEGIAYGMIIMVYMHNDSNDTQGYFDGLWNYYCRYKNENNLMTWRIYSDGTMHFPGGAATDADIDAAHALFAAHRQWGSSGSINYFDQATGLTSSVLQHEISDNNDVRPGDSWDIGNPSYFAPAVFKQFETLTGLSRWGDIAGHTYSTIVDYYFNSDETYNSEFDMHTGLLPNWCSYEGGEQSPGEWAMDYNSFWWDACRFPWRLGYDYLLHGTTNSDYAQTNTARISRFFKEKCNGDPSKICSHYTLDGRETSWNGSPNPHLGTEDTMNLAGFVGSIAVAAMVDEDRQWLDTLYARLVELPMCETGVNWGTDYFCDILKMLYLLVLTGNMPDFYSSFEVDDDVGIDKKSTILPPDEKFTQPIMHRAGNRITMIMNVHGIQQHSGAWLFDLEGKSIATPFPPTVRQAGRYCATVDGSELSSGMYFAHIHIGDRSYRQSFSFLN
ncbi:MAG: hypothetical protein GF401_16030 [Chitinivibrionales bacterium]|nr:hypothetical protein [Chitinivibrionales bacterium]